MPPSGAMIHPDLLTVLSRTGMFSVIDDQPVDRPTAMSSTNNYPFPLTRILAVMAMVILSVAATSQHLRIVDIDTGVPVPGVHAISGNDLQISGTDGKVSFSTTAGPISLSHTGYLSMIVQASDTLVRMQSSGLHLLNTVTVTAARTGRLALETDRSVSILDHRTMAARTPRTVPEALLQENGIWIQKTNHGGGSPIIRGMMGNQVLLMVDGIRMNNATYRFGPNQYLATIDPYLPDRLEVVRGGGSVLYGSDAMGGVVQSFTRDPRFGSGKRFHFTEGQIAGGWMTAGMEASGNLRLEGGNERLAISAAGSLFRFGDLVAGGTLGTLSPSGYRQYSGSLRAKARLSSQTQLTFAHQELVQREVPRYDQVRQGGFQQYAFDPQSRRLDYLRLDHHSGTAMARRITFTIFNGGTTEGLITRKSGSSTRKDQNDKVATNGFTAEMESHPGPNWTIRSGAEFYHDLVNSTASTTDLTNGLRTSVRGAYADGSTSSSSSLYTNHQVDLERFTLSGGLRYTRVALSIRDDRFGNQRINPDALVGSVSAGWKVSEPVRLYGSLHSGFRAPNVDDLSKFGTVESGVFEIPATKLKPEHSLSQEIGLKILKKKVAFTAAWYRTAVTDLVDRVAALYDGSPTFEGRNVYQKANTGEARYTGLEAEAECTMNERFTLSGNATWTFGENLTKGEPARRIPPLFGRVALRYVTGGFTFMLTGNAAGQQVRLAPGDRSDSRIAIRLIDGVMPGWYTIDVSAGWSRGPWTVNLNIRNLGDTAYRIYGSGVDGYGRHAAVRLSHLLGGR